MGGVDGEAEICLLRKLTGWLGGLGNAATVYEGGAKECPEMKAGRRVFMLNR